jgi:molecular chaperone Hsp33
MYKENYLIKALAYRQQARILFVENTELVRAACNRHPMHPILKTLLGTTVSAASLLTGILKDNQRISLKVKATQRAYKIYADADSRGNVNGYISDELANAPSKELSSITHKQLIGPNGCIQITKDIGMYGTFTGITDMPYGHIADDLSHYFEQSEQTPTYFSLSIDMDESGDIVRSRGLMAQLLPGAADDLIDRLKSDLASSNFDDMQTVGTEPVRLFCGCSKEMLIPLLHALDKDELAQACATGSPIEIVCHVCGSKHPFLPEEIARLTSIRT